MNSSSILKCNSANIGTFYDMPVLEVIKKPLEKHEEAKEIIIDNNGGKDVKSIFDVYETKANIILNKAQSDAFKILSDAQKKADDILAEAKINSQKLYSENFRIAQEKGYFDGIKQAKAQSENQINDMMEQLVNISDILVEEKGEIINGSQNMIIDLATEIAKKIVDENFIRENQGAFLTVFQNAVRNMPPAENLTVTVSNKDYKIMTYDAQNLLELAPGFKNIEIRYDATADVGTLKLENSIMVVDASVGNQINLLKQEICSLV